MQKGSAVSLLIGVTESPPSTLQPVGPMAAGPARWCQLIFRVCIGHQSMVFYGVHLVFDCHLFNAISWSGILTLVIFRTDQRKSQSSHPKLRAGHMEVQVPNVEIQPPHHDGKQKPQLDLAISKVFQTDLSLVVYPTVSTCYSKFWIDITCNMLRV